MQLKEGTLLQSGKYRIEKVLGQGGFGITYQAEQPSLRRKVAIKEFFMKEYCERDTDTSSVSLGTSGSKELAAMFMNGVRTGKETTAAVRRPIQQDHHRALTACSVAAAGTSMRSSAEYRFVATTIQTTRASISVCAFLFLRINTNIWKLS